MICYDLYRRMERYLLWVALIILSASSYVNMHRVDHVETGLDIIKARHHQYDEMILKGANAIFVGDTIDAQLASQIKQMVITYRRDMDEMNERRLILIRRVEALEQKCGTK